MRGRVAAVNAVFIGASNELGEFESGVLAAAVGPVAAVVLGGIGTIAVAALWARWFPDCATATGWSMRECGDARLSPCSRSPVPMPPS